MKTTAILDRTYSLRELDSLIEELKAQTAEDRYFLFHGPMGAGKTAWIRAWGKQLKLLDPVQSPSYNLIHEYRAGSHPGARPLTHMDWFRIEDEHQAIEAGIEESMQEAQGQVFIEWADRLPHLIPFPHIWIDLRILGSDQRKIRVERREKNP